MTNFLWNSKYHSSPGYPCSPLQTCLPRRRVPARSTASGWLFYGSPDEFTRYGLYVRVRADTPS